MLNRLHRLFRSLLVKIVFALLLFSFAFWGVGNFSLSMLNEDVLLEINGTEYPRQEFLNFSQGQIEQLGLAGVTRQNLAQNGIYHHLSESFIQQKLLEAEARESDIDVTTNIAKELIKQDPLFQDDQGVFSLAKYQDFLVENRQSEQMLINEVYASFQSNLLYFELQNSWQPVEAFDNVLWEFDRQERDVNVVTTPIIPTSDDPGQGALTAFLEDNPHALQIPEMRGGQVIAFDLKQYLDQVTVSEEEIRQSFETNLSRLRQPERRSVKILKLNEGQIPEDVLDTGGALVKPDEVFSNQTKEQLQKQVLVGEITEQAFQADKVGVLPPILSEFGTYLVEITQITDEVTPPLSNYRDLLKEQILQSKAETLLYDTIGNVEEMVLDNFLLEDILSLVSSKSPTSITTAPFDEVILEISQVASDDALALAQDFFDMSLDFEPLRVIEGKKQVFYLLSLEAVSLPKSASLEEDRNYILSLWQQMKGTDAAIARAEETLIIFPGSQPVSTYRGVRRDQRDKNASLPESIRSRLFSLSEIGETAVVTDDLAAYTIQLSKISIPQQDPNWKEAIQKEQRQALFHSYISGLREKHTVHWDDTKFQEILQSLAGL